MKILKYLITLFLIPSLVFGAVARVDTNTATRDGGTSASHAMTVSATAKLAVVCIGWDNIAGLSVTAISLNGTSILANTPGAAKENTTTHAYTQIFYMVNPPSGTPTLAVTTSAGTVDLYTNLTTYSGVDTATPVRAGSFTTATGASAAPAVTIPSAVGDKTFSCLVPGPANPTATNQTSNGFNTTGTYSTGSDTSTGSASSVTHTWTIDSSQNWSISGFSIQQLSASTIGTGPMLISRGRLLVFGRLLVMPR